MDKKKNKVTVLDLMEAHDLLRPGSDLRAALDYLEVLKSHNAVAIALADDAKEDIQRLVASINVCLLSSSPYEDDFLVGLNSLDLLLDQCHQVKGNFQFLAQHLPSFLNALIKQKNGGLISSDLPQVASKACQVLHKMTTLLAHHPEFPDLTRQLSANVSQIVTSLLAHLRTPAGGGADPEVVLDCLKVIMVTFPGACGVQTVASSIEACLLDMLNKVDNDRLAGVFALIPRVGGGGKEGQNHREAWTRQHLRLWHTLDCLINDLLGGHSRPADEEDHNKDLQVFQLEPRSGDLLLKAFQGANQVEAVCRLIMGGLRGPFPVAKVFPAKDGWLNVAQRVLGVKPCSPGHLEQLVLMTILPKIQVSMLQLLAGMVKVLGEDLLQALPQLLGFILHVLKEVNKSATVSGSGKPFPEVRVASYQLLVALCEAFNAGSGMEAHATTLLPLLLADVVPQSQSGPSLMLVKQTKKASSGRGRHHFHHNMRNNLARSSSSSSSSYSLAAACAALEAIEAVFNACGPFLRPDHHKTVASALLGQGLGDDEDFQVRLCQALVSLVANPCSAFAAPVSLVSGVFHRILKNNGPKAVRSACRNGLNLCEVMLHPRSASLNLDLPLTANDIEAINQELMKVHTVVVLSGSSDQQLLGSVQQVSEGSNGLKGNNGDHDDDSDTVEMDDKNPASKTAGSDEGSKSEVQALQPRKDPTEGLQEFRDQLAAERRLHHQLNDAKINDGDDDVILSYEESKQLMDKVYRLNSGQSASPVVIHHEEGSNEASSRVPGGGGVSKRTSKGPHQDESIGKDSKRKRTEESNDEVDLKTMLSTFTPR